MPISDLLTSGIQLMITGMGIVFAFLVLLVFALGLMSRLSFMLDNEDEMPQNDSSASNVLGKPENTALIAVISAAVSRYRSTH